MRSKREHWLLMGALVCVVGLAGDRFVISPLTALWHSRSERIAELRQSLAEGETLIDREQAIAARWEKMRDASLPRDVSLATNRALNALNDWSNASGLSLTSLKPRWQGDAADGFVLLDFRATAQGDLRSIAHFFSRLEQAELPLRVEELEIAARDDSGRTLAMDARFSGLVLTEAQE